MKRTTKVDLGFALTGAVILAAGIFGKDSEARYMGLFILAKALPKPSDYMAFFKRERAVRRVSRQARELQRQEGDDHGKDESDDPKIPGGRF